MNPLQIMCYQYASMAARATLSLCFFLFLGLGLCLGPFVCSLLLHGGKYDPETASQSGQSIVGFIGLLWSIFALLSAICLADEPGGSKLQEQVIEASEDVETRWTGVGKSARQTLVWTVIVFNTERAFTSSAIEVATSLLLEVQYSWNPEPIGYALGVVFAATALLGVMTQVVRGRLLLDYQLMMGLALASFVGSIFFLDFSGLGGPSTAYMLMFADVMNFASMFQLSGFMDGLATQAAVPNSPYSLQNYIMVKNISIVLPRAFAPPIVRWVIQAFGRNTYASMQILLTLSATAAVWFAAPYAGKARTSSR